jgi:transcriptional regulator with XRE-family HTH domain
MAKKKRVKLEPRIALGHVICQLREHAGISRADFAERLAVHKNTIYKYEMGECLTCENQVKIARELGVTWTELIYNAEQHI